MLNGSKSFDHTLEYLVKPLRIESPIKRILEDEHFAVSANELAFYAALACRTSAEASGAITNFEFGVATKNKKTLSYSYQWNILTFTKL